MEPLDFEQPGEDLAQRLSDMAAVLLAGGDLPVDDVLREHDAAVLRLAASRLARHVHRPRRNRRVANRQDRRV